VADEQGKVNLMKSKVCSKIYGKDEMFTPKISNLRKNVGRRKALVAIPGICGTGEYYMSKDKLCMLRMEGYMQ
jgi:hypothetical protein